MNTNFVMGFYFGGTFVLAVFTILFFVSAIEAKPVNDFPPKKPPVVIEGRECFIGNQVLYDSDLVLLRIADL